jgi:Flp pilus assembly protein TadG
MRDIKPNKLPGCMRRLNPMRIARRFARKQDGAAAVEFGLVAMPFLALLFAIMETAFVFFAQQTLEATAADSARLILTGQAQTSNFSAADYKTAVCTRIYGLFDCATMTVDVKNYKTSFSAVSTTAPVTAGVFDSTKTGFDMGGPGCVVAVTLYYPWPIYVSMLGDNLSTLNGSKRLLVATQVFRNEPYGGTNGC